MLSYILKRLFFMIPTMLGISLLSFTMIRLAPGNPASLLEQQGESIVQKTEEVSFESVDEFRRRYNLDKPIHIQYLTWLEKILTFDFGNSMVYPGKSVNTLLLEALPYTMGLSIATIFLTYLIAIPIGILMSVKENRLVDKFLSVFLFMLYSLPSFFVAIWLISLFASESITDKLFLGLPVNIFKAQVGATGASFSEGIYIWFIDILKRYTLPVICLTIGSYAYLSRQMRGSMLEVLRKDYIKTARSKGLSEKIVVFKHALRNSLIPIITIAASILPAIIGGNVIIEQVFNIPGLGRLGFEGIQTRDYNLIMAILYLSSLLTLFGILLSDILYVVINPQITFDDKS